jgi:hypothetical protein
MAQANRSTRPKTTCCRCRRRAEGTSRLTNLGWLCDNCYELLNRSALGRRLYRLVYQLSSRDEVTGIAARRVPSRVDTVAILAAAAREGERAGAREREIEALAA